MSTALPRAVRSALLIASAILAVATAQSQTATTTQKWNALNQLVEATDARGIKTTYVYNAFDEIVRESSPDIGTIVYERDAGGNVSAKTDGNGLTTRFAYDAISRLTRVEYADGQVTRLFYDLTPQSIGSLGRIEDLEGTLEYSPDPMGRVASKTQTLKNGATHTVRYSHAHGHLASITYPSGRVVRYTLHLGQVTGITVNDQPFLSGVAYTALGAARSWSWASGDSALRVFDSDARMTRNEFATYTHDAAGRITNISQQLYRGPAPWRTEAVNYTIGYDGRHRITSFARIPSANPQLAENEIYRYDLNGNRLNSRSAAVIDPRIDDSKLGKVITAERAYKIDENSNRLLGFAQTMAQTDPKGRVKASASVSVLFRLDAAGAQTSDGLNAYKATSWWAPSSTASPMRSTRII